MEMIDHVLFLNIFDGFIEFFFHYFKKHWKNVLTYHKHTLTITVMSKCQMMGCDIYTIQLLLIPSVQDIEARSPVQTEMDGSV